MSVEGNSEFEFNSWDEVGNQENWEKENSGKVVNIKKIYIWEHIFLNPRL